MLEDFIYAQKAAQYEEQFAAGNVPDTSITFVEEDGGIWNRGHSFGGMTPKQLERLNSIEIQAKEADEIYTVDVQNFSTEEDFNNLKSAVDAGKTIVIDTVEGISLCKVSTNSESVIILLSTFLYPYSEQSNNGTSLSYKVFTFNADGTASASTNLINLLQSGDGTKFLSDNGTYKEIDITSATPYVFTPKTTTVDSVATLNEEQYNELIAAIEAKRPIVYHLEEVDFYAPCVYTSLSGDIILECFGVFGTSTPQRLGMFITENRVFTFTATQIAYKSDVDNIAPYIFNYTGQTSVTQDEYDGLKAAIEDNRVVIVNYNNLGKLVGDCAVNSSEGLIGMSLYLATTTADIETIIITESLVVSSVSRKFATEDDLANKQNTITDLETIRTNAALGATALQEVPVATDTTLGGVKKVTVSKLAEDVDVTTVVTAYNELIDKLVTSGIAVVS